MGGPSVTPPWGPPSGEEIEQSLADMKSDRANAWWIKKNWHAASWCVTRIIP